MDIRGRLSGRVNGTEGKCLIMQASNNFKAPCHSISDDMMSALNTHLKTAGFEGRRVVIVGQRGIADRSIGMFRSALKITCSNAPTVAPFYSSRSILTEQEFASLSSFIRRNDIIIFLRQPDLISDECLKLLFGRDLTIFALRACASQANFFDGAVSSCTHILPDDSAVLNIVRSIISNILETANHAAPSDARVKLRSFSAK
jgi:hypothetical protein